MAKCASIVAALAGHRRGRLSGPTQQPREEWARLALKVTTQRNAFAIEVVAYLERGVCASDLVSVQRQLKIPWHVAEVAGDVRFFLAEVDRNVATTFVHEAFTGLCKQSLALPQLVKALFSTGSTVMPHLSGGACEGPHQARSEADNDSDNYLRLGHDSIIGQRGIPMPLTARMP